MDAGSIGAISASVAVPIAFAVLRRVFPAPRRADVGRSQGELRKEYARWEPVSVALFFVLAPVATYLWWRAFLAFATGCGFTHEGAVYALRPSRIAWLLPAIFLGMMSAGPPIEAIVRRLLGHRYAEYLAYVNLRHGIDTEALAKPLYLGVSAVSALGVFLMATWYAVFTPTGIRLDSLLGLRERVYEYRDLVSIETAPAFVAPSGETVHHRQYVLHFSDATSWNTNFDPADATEAQLGSLMQAVAEWSGVPISELPVLTRDEYQ